MTKGYEQRKESNKKYLEKLEEIKLRVPKGDKDVIKKDAEACGYSSVNSFIIDAVRYYTKSILGE